MGLTPSRSLTIQRKKLLPSARILSAVERTLSAIRSAKDLPDLEVVCKMLADLRASEILQVKALLGYDKAHPPPPSVEKESYFASCERNEQGRCLPKGQAGVARGGDTGKRPVEEKPRQKTSLSLRELLPGLEGNLSDTEVAGLRQMAAKPRVRGMYLDVEGAADDLLDLLYEKEIIKDGIRPGTYMLSNLGEALVGLDKQGVSLGDLDREFPEPASKKDLKSWEGIYAVFRSHKLFRQVVEGMGISEQQLLRPMVFHAAMTKVALANANKDVIDRLRQDKDAQGKVGAIANQDSEDTREEDEAWRILHESIGSIAEKYQAATSQEERDQLQAEMEEKTRQLRTARDRYEASRITRASKVRDLLAVPESSRATIQVEKEKGPPVSAGVQEAMKQSLDWVRSITADPGKFSIVLGETTDDRSFYSYEDRSLKLAGPYVGDGIHELGHALENNVPGIYEAAVAFLEARCKGDRAVAFKDLPGGGGYAASEAGRKDRFDQAFDGVSAYYVGKTYQESTEIISMGIEKLYTDPVRFASKDPEYCAFIVSVLNGTLRGRALPDE